MINTFTGYGSTPLQYPHHTKWMNGKIHLVTTPDKRVQAGDKIECVHYGTDEEGKEMVINIFEYPFLVKSVLEERKARGNHRAGVDAIFQLLTY